MIFYLLLKCWFNNCLREACLLLETVSLRRAMWLMGILFIMNCTEAYGHVSNHIAWFDNSIDVFIDHDDYSEWGDTLLSCLYYLLDQLHCQICSCTVCRKTPGKIMNTEWENIEAKFVSMSTSEVPVSSKSEVPNASSTSSSKVADESGATSKQAPKGDETAELLAKLEAANK